MTVYCGSCKKVLAYIPPLEDGMVMGGICTDCLCAGFVKVLQDNKEKEKDDGKKDPDPEAN